jgi:hypothetical protein
VSVDPLSDQRRTNKAGGCGGTAGYTIGDDQFRNPQGLHSYSYGLNDSANRTDRSGLTPSSGPPSSGPNPEFCEPWRQDCTHQLPGNNGLDIGVGILKDSEFESPQWGENPFDFDPFFDDGPVIDLYYYYVRTYTFKDANNLLMRACIYADCLSNRGKDCASGAGYTDYRPARDSCPKSIHTAVRKVKSWWGIVTQCKQISHYDFFDRGCPD